MAKKKGVEPAPETTETTVPGDAAPAEANVNGTGNGNGESRKPAFKVGPIATSKDNAVSVAVWANEVTADGDTFTVYNVTCECRYRVDGEWKSGKQFRGSQIYALLYALEKASSWILAQRDPANECPF